uniref:Major facilitator superfamily domain containing 1 n=1 Tax=Papio anubis TaxID=9555 RepID=A0A8I5R7Z9_PAPAN
MGVALRDLPGRHVNARSHVTAVLVVLCGRCFLLGLGVVTAFLSPSPASAMEEEDEEARALLAGGPDEADRGAPAAAGALPALCDPSRLAHRLLVLLLMCFLGFGETGACCVTQPGVQCCERGLLQSPPPGLKQSSRLSLPSSWDCRPGATTPGFIIIIFRHRVLQCCPAFKKHK